MSRAGVTTLVRSKIPSTLLLLLGWLAIDRGTCDQRSVCYAGNRRRYMKARTRYMKPKKLLIFIVALAVSPAVAQNPIDVGVATDRWASENNVFVTTSARNQLHEFLAASLSNSVGLPKESASALSQEIRDTG